jgi:hypothetical protein
MSLISKIIVTVIITAVIVGGGIYYWQNSAIEKLKNEQQVLQLAGERQGMYINDKYGYEFKYPNIFITWEMPDSKLVWASNLECSKDESFSFKTKKGCQYVNVDVLDRKILMEGEGIIKETKILGGIEGEKIINLSDTNVYSGSMLVQVEKNGQWYVLHIVFNPADRQIAEDILNQISETFRFE